MWLCVSTVAGLATQGFASLRRQERSRYGVHTGETWSVKPEGCVAAIGRERVLRDWQLGC